MKGQNVYLSIITSYTLPAMLHTTCNVYFYVTMIDAIMPDVIKEQLIWIEYDCIVVTAIHSDGLQLFPL